MSKQVLILTTIVLVFSAGGLNAAVVHSTWVGGEWGDWGNASNWNPTIVPDNSDWRTFTVTIDSNSIGVKEVEVTLQQNRTIDWLECYGEVSLEMCFDRSGLTLKNTTGMTNYGNLSIEGKWHKDISCNLRNTSDAELYLEDLEIDGDIFNAAEGTIGIKGKVDTDDGNLENFGLILIAPGSEFYIEEYVQNDGQIKIYGGAFGSDDVLVNNALGIVEGFGVFRASQLLQNKGTICADGGTLTIAWFEEATLLNSGVLSNKPLASMHIKPAVDVNNLGTIEVNADGGVAFDCNLVNESGAMIKLLAGTLAAQTITQLAGATFEGFGGITGNIVIDPNGIIKLTGPTNIIGDVTIKEGAVLEISDGTTLITGKTNCNGTIYMKGGWIIPQGGLSGDCNIIWEPGIYTNIADFNLDGMVNLKDFAVFADTWLWQTGWH